MYKRVASESNRLLSLYLPCMIAHVMEIIFSFGSEYSECLLMSPVDPFRDAEASSSIQEKSMHVSISIFSRK